MKRNIFSKSLIAALLVLMMVLSACGSKEEKSAATVEPTPASTPAPAYQKVEIVNAGHTFTFTKAPSRAITLNQHATEVMLALGLEKSMVGTAYLDDKILPEFEGAYSQIKVLSKEYPSKEIFLAEAPDFAYAGWKSAFTEKTLGTPEELAKLGIPTYIQESSEKTAPTLEDVYKDILNIGRIFNVEAKANEIIDKISQELTQIKDQIGEVTKPIKVFVYDSGEDKPFTAANSFLTNLINRVGGKNIFDDIQKGWAEVSWEEVINRNPDIIVVIDYGDQTVEQKKKLLLSKPELADVTAIKNKKLIVLPLSAAAEGIRASMAMKILAEGFYPDKFK